MTWRDDLQPASFRGVTFHVEVSTREGGRRNVPHEFPKRNRGFTEDMGKRLRAFSIDGYLIGDDHHREANALVEALEADGAGLLELPLQSAQSVICDTFAETQRREEGGFTVVSMTFIEAGSDTSSPVAVVNTAAAVLSAAAELSGAVAANGNARVL